MFLNINIFNIMCNINTLTDKTCKFVLQVIDKTRVCQCIDITHCIKDIYVLNIIYA